MEALTHAAVQMSMLSWACGAVLTESLRAVLCSWGAVDRREGFHTAVQIWPCAYEATFPDAQLESAVYISRIQADPEAEGPDFMVSLRTADGQEKVGLLSLLP